MRGGHVHLGRIRAPYLCPAQLDYFRQLALRPGLANAVSDDERGRTRPGQHACHLVEELRFGRTRVLGMEVGTTSSEWSVHDVHRKGDKHRAHRWGARDLDRPTA